MRYLQNGVFTNELKSVVTHKLAVSTALEGLGSLGAMDRNILLSFILDLPIFQDSTTQSVLSSKLDEMSAPITSNPKVNLK